MIWGGKITCVTESRVTIKLSVVQTRNCFVVENRYSNRKRRNPSFLGQTRLQRTGTITATFYKVIRRVISTQVSQLLLKVVLKIESIARKFL